MQSGFCSLKISIVNSMGENKLFFDDLTLGMTVDIPPASIEKEKMIAFACDYDSTPLHIIDEYAPTTHFGKLIALGAMSFTSVWAKYHEIDFFDEELLAGKSTKTERLKPVFENDILSVRATITDLVKRNDKNGLVEVSIDVHSQNGELVLKDITEAIMKCKNTIEN